MNLHQYRNQRLQILNRQQQFVFYTWWFAKVVNIIIISIGTMLVFSGKFHYGSLTTVAGVLSQMSVGGFAKHNQSRLDKQIQTLMKEMNNSR